MKNLIFKLAGMIKVEHTIFSLPFVISASLLAVYYQGFKPIDFMVFFWIALCLLAGRSAGMALNRLVDADIDAKNPRTQNRELPSGQISKKSALVFIAISLIIFIFSALQLPSLCKILMPIALLWLLAYSYLKRITWLCHFFLGTTLGGATLGGWIAITNSIDTMAPIYLALAVTFWVSGFDIIYATQDEGFDREHKLHSIPAQFGKVAAFRIARLCHLLTPILLYLCGQELNLGLYYKLGILVVIAALFYEQKLANENKIEAAFFTVNSWISVIICLSIVFDIFIV